MPELDAVSVNQKYLEELTDEHTLVMMSGHPMGLFKSHKTSPRVIVTNGLMVGMFVIRKTGQKQQQWDALPTDR